MVLDPEDAEGFEGALPVIEIGACRHRPHDDGAERFPVVPDPRPDIILRGVPVKALVFVVQGLEFPGDVLRQADPSFQGGIELGQKGGDALPDVGREIAVRGHLQEGLVPVDGRQLLARRLVESQGHVEGKARRFLDGLRIESLFERTVGFQPGFLVDFRRGVVEGFANRFVHGPAGNGRRGGHRHRLASRHLDGFSAGSLRVGPAAGDQQGQDDGHGRRQVTGPLHFAALLPPFPTNIG